MFVLLPMRPRISDGFHYMCCFYTAVQYVGHVTMSSLAGSQATNSKQYCLFFSYLDKTKQNKSPKNGFRAVSMQTSMSGQRRGEGSRIKGDMLVLTNTKVGYLKEMGSTTNESYLLFTTLTCSKCLKGVVQKFKHHTWTMHTPPLPQSGCVTSSC